MSADSRTPRFVFRPAELLEVALPAFGIPRRANLASMMNDLVREADPSVLRNHLHQLLLNFFHCVGFGQFQAAGDAEDVRVDDNTLSFAES